MNTVYSVVKAVAKSVTAFLCAVTVYLYYGSAAHILFVVDTVLYITSEVGHLLTFLSSVMLILLRK